jgi:chromosomal replication initiation ATPase DnaA
MKHETTLSLTSIGRLLGARDHSTTLKSVRRHQARIDAGEVMP